ncbi:hypothetical protein J9236_00105 [Providencia rettgeri]|uniref:hypothetical protein n=1 Tax=Providencia rettgeri TaxID=587 RepID=UPI001B3964D0|nr:hypothetical protein [Providencia rettgeri]MBQ0339642.1 hypothetical protein [Providencia rettgeri]
MDKSRQQFEEWFKKERNKKRYDEDTILLLYGALFDVWQASRESLEVELPAPFIANETWCYDEDLVNQALISNGVKIKNE